MRKLRVSILCAFALSSTLYAGGKLVEPPIVPPINIVSDTWSGIYIGLSAGYIKGKGKLFPKIDNYSYGNLDFTNTLSSTTFKPDGFIGGVYFGYNKLIDNNIVIGIEGAVNYANAKDSELLSDDGDGIFGNTTIKQNLEYALYGKLGVVVGNNRNLMPYILAGATGTKLKANSTIYTDAVKDSDTVYGFTVGTGLEYKISKNMHIRVQYRFSKYADAKFSHTVNDLDYKTVYSAKFKDYKTHTIQAGFSYHF